MARYKRPALTSPWKIGFLVSLLLVAVSIGVGYFVTRSFGITWSWIEFHGSWSEWTFRRAPFMSEMLPLVAVVAVFALFANLVVTGAVRRYRSYLDSGVDYKHLLQSMRRLEDLQDEDQIRKLTSHPELRNFLLNLRTSVMERQNSLDAKAAALADREGDASRRDTLESDADVLVSAIISAADGGFGRELALSIPELKRVEAAVREHLIERDANDAKERLNSLHSGIVESTSTLSKMLREIHDELSASARSARELESDVDSLRSQVASAAPVSHDGEGNDAAEIAVGRLDSITGILKALGEETRSVAINTALQASSADGSGESVVKLADDVRGVAGKFNGVAEQWEEASEVARRAFASARGGTGGSDRIDGSIESLSSKVGLWVERTVILSEKLKSFERHFDEAFTGLDTGEVHDDESTGDWKLEKTGEAPAGAEPDEIEVTSSADFERPGSLIDLESAAEADDEQTDTTGFEKQEDIFSEVAAAGSDTEMFADIPTAGKSQRVEPVEPTETVETVEPMEPVESIEPVEPESEAASPVVDEVLEAPDDAFEEIGFESKKKPTDVIDVPGRQREFVIDDEPPVHDGLEQSSPMDDIIAGPNLTDDRPSADEDAVDLYELGAVDYEPENIHPNA